MFSRPIKPNKEGDRDKDLENMLGNLLITQYQLERLQVMVANHVEVVGESRLMFKVSDSWYKVYINIEKQLSEEEEKALLEKAAEKQVKDTEAEEGFSALGASEIEPDPEVP